MNQVTIKECVLKNEKLREELRSDNKEQSTRHHKELTKLTKQTFLNYERMDKMSEDIVAIRLVTERQEGSIKTLYDHHKESRTDHKELVKKIDNFIDKAPEKFSSKLDYVFLRNLVVGLLGSTALTFLGLMVSLIKSFI